MFAKIIRNRGSLSPDGSGILLCSLRNKRYSGQQEIASKKIDYKYISISPSGKSMITFLFVRSILTRNWSIIGIRISFGP